MIGFIWELCLLALVVVPLLAWWYSVSLRRRGGGTALHTDSEFLEALRAPRFARRRDLPAVLFGLALLGSVVALARPTAPVPTLDNRTTIMLALDVSGSMRNTDVQPSRFIAAQEAARNFVNRLPGDVNLGLVSFAGSAAVNVTPGTERSEILSAIDALFMERGTAIGGGIRESLSVLPGRNVDGKKLEPGAPPAIIVLMTDGRNNRDPDPLEMATLAREQGVRVYTIGLGTPGQTSNTSPFAGFDPEVLQSIASTTGGKYFAASSAGELNSIFGSLGSSLGWVFKPGEVTHLVAAVAGVLLLLSLVVGERNRRVI